MSYDLANEKLRKGDPAFIITREEMEQICAEDNLPPIWLPNEFGDDGDMILLCDGCLLHGNYDTEIWYGGTTEEEATWFIQERAAGERPIVTVENQW